jgi:hypothetical protein
VNQSMGQSSTDEMVFGFEAAATADGGRTRRRRMGRKMRWLAIAVGLMMIGRGVVQIGQGAREAMGASHSDRPAAAAELDSSAAPVDLATDPTPAAGLDTQVATDGQGDADGQIAADGEAVADAQVAGDLQAAPDGADYDGYQSVTVESDAYEMSLDVPSDWAEQRSDPWEVDDEVVGEMVSVAPHLQAFFEGYYVPGVILAASREMTLSYDGPAAMLDDLAGSIGTGGCTYQGRSDYEDGWFHGVQDLYGSCGEVGASILVIGAEPPDGDFLVYVLVQMVSEADTAAAQAIMDSFTVE